MFAIAPAMQIICYSILKRIFFFYNSEVNRFCACTLEFLWGMQFCKTGGKSYCSDTTGGQVRLDSRSDFEPKSRSTSDINVVERPQNATNSILLDMICKSIQICDLIFCFDSLNHMHILRNCLKPFH